jgi:creatinine amidohydrolase
MLIAVDADPHRCGYTDAQIAACLDAIATQGIHQEAEGVAHLRYLLDQKGRVTFPPDTKKRLKPHAEVLSLRYDNRRSPLTGIPLNLRRPLIGKVLEHADGALLRNRRRWVEFDPLRDPGMETPYAYEVTTARGGEDSRTSRMRPASYLWGEMTWPEADVVFEDVDVAILPVGAIEQHGPHLPLDTDTRIALALAEGAAARLRRVLVAPPLPYGSSGEHADFPGTLSIGREATELILVELCRSASASFSRIVLVSAHGGNAAPLARAVARLRGEGRDVLAFSPRWGGDAHAGRTETSLMLALDPGRVAAERAVAGNTDPIERLISDLAAVGVRELTSTGVLGDPAGASAAEGRDLLEAATAELARVAGDRRRPGQRARR